MSESNLPVEASKRLRRFDLFMIHRMPIPIWGSRCRAPEALRTSKEDLDQCSARFGPVLPSSRRRGNELPTSGTGWFMLVSSHTQALRGSVRPLRIAEDKAPVWPGLSGTGSCLVSSMPATATMTKVTAKAATASPHAQNVSF